MCVQVQLCISSHLQKPSIWDLRPHIWSALNKTLNLSQSSVWNLKRCLRTILFSYTIFVRWNMPSDQLCRNGIGLFTTRIVRNLASATYLCLRLAWARIRSMRTRSEERSWFHFTHYNLFKKPHEKKTDSVVCKKNGLFSFEPAWWGCSFFITSLFSLSFKWAHSASVSI